jgi:L-iditol 2-dehydrogenase
MFEPSDMLAALKTAEGAFTVETTAMPEMKGDDWAIARVRCAGICGTDLRHWLKAERELEGEVMGHELAGDVVEVGPKVENVKPGDRVVIETVLGDDACEWCKIQRYNVCPELYPVRMKSVSRAFAQYVAGPAKKFYKLPDHVSYEEAALLDTFSVCMHALQISNQRINEKVAVVGGGNIGMGQLQLCKLAGAEVIVTDVVDSALDLAKELGADAVVNTKTQDGKAAVTEFTKGRGVDIAFECAGGESMSTTLHQAVDYTRIGGKVVIVGGFDKGDVAIPLPWQRIQMGEIQVLPSASYSYWGSEPEMLICLDLLSKGKLDAQRMITHRFKLSEINEAFTKAADKEHSHTTFVALEID